jgi:hypothetical protein
VLNNKPTEATYQQMFDFYCDLADVANIADSVSARALR